MKPVLLILLAAFNAAAYAQQDLGLQHFQANPAQMELSLRSEEFLKVSNDRQAARYAENRQRCQTALKVAELCGKFAGKFSCDEKGFKPISGGAAIKPVVLDTYKMELCAVQAAKNNP